MITTFHYAQGQKHSFELEAGQIEDKLISLLSGGHIFSEPSVVIGDEREVAIVAPALLSRVDVYTKDPALLKVAEVAHGRLLENLGEADENEHIRAEVFANGCDRMLAGFHRMNRLPVEIFATFKRLFTFSGILLTHPEGLTLLNPKQIQLIRMVPGLPTMPKDALFGSLKA